MMVCASEGPAGHLHAVCKPKAPCYHSLYAKDHDSCADDQSSGFLLHTVVFHHLAPFIDRRLVCMYCLAAAPGSHGRVACCNKMGCGVCWLRVASCLQDRNGEMKIRALVCPSLRKYYESDTLMVLTGLCNRCSQAMLS